MKHKRNCLHVLFIICIALFSTSLSHASANQPPKLLNDIVDISGDFHDFTNTYFFADSLSEFDPGMRF